MQHDTLAEGVRLGGLEPEMDGTASARETSAGVKWVLGSKVVGHVNSATRRKPKKARQHAAQNMRWSNKSNARERWMTLSRGAVIGNRDKREGAAC